MSPLEGIDTLDSHGVLQHRREEMKDESRPVAAIFSTGKCWISKMRVKLKIWPDTNVQFFHQEFNDTNFEQIGPVVFEL